MKKIRDIGIIIAMFTLLSNAASGDDIFIDSYRFVTPSGPVDLSIDPNLQGYWDFENNLTDSSSRGNDLSGTPTSYSDTTLVKQGTYSLYNGSASNVLSRIDASLSSAFPGKNGTTTGAMSFGGWFRATDISAVAHLIIKGSYASPMFQAYLYQSKLHANFSGTLIHGTTTLSSNTNYWFCVVYDGAHINLYLGQDDGINPATDATPVNKTGNIGTDSNPFYVLSADNSASLVGYMDEVFVFNRALSPSEINSIKLHGIKGDR
jgi:hypothetical protein